MADQKLQTRNVFIDTSIFVSENFSVNGTKFETLIGLAQNEQVFVKSTEITIREIEVKIKEAVQDAEKAIVQTRKKARILRNLGPKSEYKRVFDVFPTERIVNRIKKQFKSYLKKSNTKILQALKIRPNCVFDKYFNNEPPFGSEKKKSEFPDAFMLFALEKWCEQNGQNIYVITKDNDMKAACTCSERLLYIPTLQEFLELVLRNNLALTKLIHQRFAKNQDKIKSIVKEKVQDLWIWLEDQDGEATITSVYEVILGNESIIKMSDFSATVEFDATISFQAEISYDDLDTASYDSEEKRLIAWQKIEDTVEREVTLPVELAFEFSPDDNEHFLLHHVMINDGEPFRIWADEEAETFYK